MLQLYKRHTLRQTELHDPEVFCDEQLITVVFLQDYIDEGDSSRTLSKFRFIRKSGSILSLDLRAGLITSLELLGVPYPKWENIVDLFSDEIETKEELPVLSIELDGSNSDVEIGMMTIDQERDFTVSFDSKTSMVDICFGNYHFGCRFGSGILFFDDSCQLVGIRFLWSKGQESI